MNEFIREVEITRCGNGKKIRTADPVIREYVLPIKINGKPFFDIVCTPDQPENLAAGYLFTQKIVTDKAEIAGIEFDKNNFEVRITLCEKAANRLNTMDKAPKRKGSSGGLLFPESNSGGNSPGADKLRITCGEVLGLIRQHHEKSSLFKQTGAVHSCAICNKNDIVRFYEDIGRHNAFDKMAGDILLNRMDTAGGIVTASCRISLEILQKIKTSSFSIVISNAAPTLSALQAAESSGITVVGFARNHRCNIYTHDYRVIDNHG